MMYIFISGYDYEYRANIYRTLIFPKDTLNSYTFKNAGLSAVINKIEDCVNEGKTIKIVIIFVDRYGGEDGVSYEYYPIRTATYCSHEENSSDGRVTFYVKLDDYAFPKEYKNIQKDICRLGDIPKKSSNNNVKDDGQYITIRDEDIIRSDKYCRGADAWIAAVKTLGTKRAFLATENKELDIITEDELNNTVPFFYRLEYIKKGKLTGKYMRISPAAPRRDDTGNLESPLCFSEKNKYILRIYYYFPYWETDTNAAVSLEVSSDDSTQECQSINISYNNDMDITGQCVKSMPLNPPKTDGYLYVDVKAENLASGKRLVNFKHKINSHIIENKNGLVIAIVSVLIVIIMIVKFLFGYLNLPEEQKISLFQYFIEQFPELSNTVLDILK